MNLSEIELLVGAPNSSEHDMWIAISSSSDISLGIIDSLLNHPNVSDRIIMAYFAGEIGFDEDSFEDRGDRLSEQFFWWDVEVACNFPALSIQTRVEISRAIAQELLNYLSLCNEDRSECKNRQELEDWEPPGLAFFVPEIPLTLFKIDGNYFTGIELRQFAQVCREMQLAANLLADFLSKFDLQGEWSDRVSTLRAGVAAVDAFLAANDRK